MSTQNITPFLFEGEALVRVISQEGEPWFVGLDACRILEIRDHRQALERLDEDERGRYSIPTPGGLQEMIIVSEPGLYRLIFGSKKPVAERLKRWMAHDVLPALRKTGSYAMPNAEAPSPELPPDTAENDNLKLRKIGMVRDIFGNKPARQMYLKLGLETVPAMFEVERQGDLLEPMPPAHPQSITITVPVNGQVNAEARP